MSMTRQEAIEKFEGQLHAAMVVLDSGFGTRPGESDRLYRQRKEMAEIALQALQEQEERENPKPLTIEELHGMIGEPVWVQGPGLPQYGRWAIVEEAFGNSLYLVNDFTCHDIGKTWIAYHHKPKEESHEQM